MTTVGIPEASRMLGISQDTVRKRIKTGEIPAEKVKAAGGYKWMVVVPEAADDVDDGLRNDHHQDGPPDGGTDSNALVMEMKARIASLEEQLATRTREISELHQIIGAKALGPGVDRPWWKLWSRG